MPNRTKANHKSQNTNHFDKAPRKHQKPKRKPDKGLVMVYTGEGKGKTTAAFGTVLRALGSGMKVAMIQFIKGAWQSGEETALKKFSGCKVLKVGEGFTWDTKDFVRDAAKAEQGWLSAQKFILDSKTDLVVLDEINCCFDYGFLKIEPILEILKEKPVKKHVILTGRGAPKKLIQFADLVTEMKCIKHPYNSGIWAQRGIDF